MSPRSGPATSFLSGLSAGATRGRKVEQSQVADPGGPSKSGSAPLCQQGGHKAAGIAAAPVIKAPGIQSFHTRPCPHIETFSLYPGRSPRSPTLAGQAVWRKPAQAQLLCTCTGCVYFSAGCLGNRNNSCCRKPLHATAWLPNQRQHLCLSSLFYRPLNSEPRRSLHGAEMTLRARQLSCTGRVWIFEPQHSWEAAERLMQAMSNRLWGALYKRLNRKHSKWAAQGTSDPRVYTQA